MLRESAGRWGDYLGVLDPGPDAADAAPFAEPPPPADPDDAPAAIDTGTLFRLLTGGTACPTPVADGPDPPAPALAPPRPQPAPAPPRGRAALEVPTPPTSVAIDPEMRETFLEEGADLFDRIEALVLGLGRGIGTADTLNEIGRCFHTLKGAAGSVGLVQVSALVHAVESELEGADGQAPEALVDDLHRVLHYLDGVFLALRRGPGAAVPAEGPGPAPATAPPRDAEAPPPRPEPASRADDPPAPRRPAAPTAVPLSPAAGGRPTGGAADAAAAIPAVVPAPAAEPDSAEDAQAAPGEGPVRVPAERIDELMDLVSELITRRGLWSAQTQTMKEFATAARTCRHRLAATIDRLRESGAFQEQPPPTTGRHRRSSDQDDVSGVLRRLAEQAEDLAVLTEAAQASAEPLADNSDALARTSLQLWESLQAVRIVPVRGLFQRLARVAHDAARVEGRQVAVAMVGEETGLDRAVQDKAFEPLLHVVRNAVSHGIEPAAERLAAGKPATGRVTLEAARSGNTLVLSVRDDGRGLDYAAIAAKGRRLGLIGPGDEPGVDRLNALIFQPGFSTREEANAIAGRGVGMDVVSQEVGRLHGTVELESQSGHGTRLSLRLPARLSLQQAMVLRVDGRAFALPVELVELAQAYEPGVVDRDGDAPRAFARGQWVPLVSARAALGLPPADPASCPKLLLIRADGGPLAVAVDAIEGTRELVVKPLAPLLNGHPTVSGTSLSVTGEVILTLNPSGLARWAGGTGRRDAPAAERPGAGRAAPVLVVDDSISVRKVVARHLRSLGLEVEEVSDGLEALGRLRTRTYALVVSDLEMPRMDGFELLAELNRLAIAPAVPVVVASTKSDGETRRRVLGLGAREFLAKPIDPDAMTALVGSLLAPGGRAGATPVGSNRGSS